MWGRWGVYLLVALAITLPMVLPVRIRMVPTPPVRSFFRMVEQIPKGKALMIAADFDTGTEGENGPQVEAVLEHAMSRKIPILIMGTAIQGPELVQSYAEDLAKKYDYRYGRDFVNLGYLPGGQPVLEKLGRSIWQTKPTDYQGKPLSQLPMMRRVRTAKDIALVAEFTGAGVLPWYIQTFWAQFRVPLAQGCTGIIGPEQFPYLDSGQLSGLMTGLTGAAQYEHLIKAPKRAYRRMIPQNFAHITVIVLIVLANIRLFAERARRLRGR